VPRRHHAGRAGHIGGKGVVMTGQYEKTTLPNGLRIITVPNNRLHYFVVSAYVGMGPRYEPVESCGISHFLEHMIFQGSRSFPDSSALSRAIDRIGGQILASTSGEYTHFGIGVHKKYFARAIEILADILLYPKFDPQEVEQEKRIVLEEQAQYHDRRQRNLSVEELAYNMLWRRDQQDLSTAGTTETIRGFTDETIRRHWRRFFVAGNMVICLAGAFDVSHAIDRVSEAFGSLGNGDVPQPLPADLSQHEPRWVFRKLHTPAMNVVLSHRAVPFHHPDYTAYWVLSEALGGGSSSRLFLRVREQLGLVYDISAGLTCGADLGALDVATTVREEHLVETVREILRITNELARDGISREELEICKEKLRCVLEIGLDDPVETAGWYGRQELLLRERKVISFEDELREIDQLTLEDVARVSRESFVPQRRNLAAVGPVGFRRRRIVANLLAS